MEFTILQAMLTIITSILVPMLGGFAWILTRIGSLDRRLSHLEGAFEERGRWEVKVKK